MSERTFCNCHWSRQVSYMRHCWNKIFFVIIRVMVVLNQIIVMSPFICLKNSKGNCFSVTATAALQFRRRDYAAQLAVEWKFRTHRLVTAVASILLIVYAAVSPFMVKMASEIYLNMRLKRDNIFVTVAIFIMSTDVLCFLLIMASNIWHRENIVKILNLLYAIISKFKQLDQNLIGLKIVLALTFKVALRTHDVVLSLPYIFTYASHYTAQSKAAYFFTHYMFTLGCIFELNMFTFILLFLACSWQLEKELQCSQVTSHDLTMSQLMSLRDSLQRLMALFTSTFQFGISLMILLYFVTILCNLYAMIDFYVTTHVFFSTFITYLISLTVELYSLIYVVYLCDRSQRKVKDLFLLREELWFLKPSNPLSIVERSVLWPQLNDFQLLGLFTLNHESALFIFTYSLNFVLIILEFEVNKARK